MILSVQSFMNSDNLHTKTRQLFPQQQTTMNLGAWLLQDRKIKREMFK